MIFFTASIRPMHHRHGRDEPPHVSKDGTVGSRVPRYQHQIRYYSPGQEPVAGREVCDDTAASGGGGSGVRGYWSAPPPPAVPLGGVRSHCS